MTEISPVHPGEVLMEEFLEPLGSHPASAGSRDRSAAPGSVGLHGWRRRGRDLNSPLLFPDQMRLWRLQEWRPRGDRRGEGVAHRVLLD
jgi:hypothetical protein